MMSHYQRDVRVLRHRRILARHRHTDILNFKKRGTLLKTVGEPTALFLIQTPETGAPCCAV